MTKDFLMSVLMDVMDADMTLDAKWVHHVGFDNPT
jgi:hypothetical protein